MATARGKGRGTARPKPPAGDGPPLTASERRRYARHLLLPEVGETGQRRLKGARVLVVGTGGLGAPAALYLAAAGVGTIGLADSDRVEASNLQRQILFSTEDVGRPKIAAAALRIQGLNPEIAVVPHELEVDAQNVLDVLQGYEVVVDGTDNFPARYLLNDACVRLGIPDVFGSVFRFEGQVSVFGADDGPCYRCLFPEPPPPEAVPDCAVGGVLGVLPGVVGLLQATEAIKLLLGRGDPLVGRLLLYDALELSFRELSVSRDPHCPRCRPGHRDDPIFPMTSGGTSPTASGEIGATELADALAGATPPQLVDVRQPMEYALGHLAGSLLVPLGELADRAGELDRSRPVVVYCSHGVRSARGTTILRGIGLPDVRSLRGGLSAWEGALGGTRIETGTPGDRARRATRRSAR